MRWESLNPDGQSLGNSRPAPMAGKCCRHSVIALGLCALLLGALYRGMESLADGRQFDAGSLHPAAGNPSPQKETSPTKVAEGEYAFIEQENGGAVGPFDEEIYNFHESWTLSRVEDGDYRVDGLRTFESPKGEVHSDRFAVDLSRDRTVIRMTEFAKLKWVPDSGPLSCEFLPADLRCTSGGSDPSRTIELQQHFEGPYGLLWPISPFSLTGLVRQIERDPAKPIQASLVTIAQPSAATPVQPTILAGPLRYVGQQTIRAGQRKWQADEFSLKVPLHPELLVWTSSDGIVLAVAFEHGHKDWPQEGLRLVRYRNWIAF